MSHANGLLVRKDTERSTGVFRFVVSEYDASTGHEYQLTTFRTLEQAVVYAEDYQRRNIVEYGIRFDLGGDPE